MGRSPLVVTFVGLVIVSTAGLWLAVRGPRDSETQVPAPGKRKDVSASAQVQELVGSRTQDDEGGRPEEPSGQAAPLARSLPAQSAGIHESREKPARHFIEGCVLVDDGLLDRPKEKTNYECHLTLRVVYDEPLQVRFSSFRGLDANGCFRVRKHPDVSYTLQVRCNDEVLVEIPEVRATNEDALPDPRLNPIDLRGQLTSIRLGVRSGDGGRASPDINYRTSDTEEGWRPSDSGWIVTTASRVDVEIVTSGYQDVSLRGISNDREVVLERGPQILLALDRDCLDLAQRGVRVEMTVEGIELGVHEQIIVQLDHAGEARLVLGRPGRYHALMHVWRGVTDLNGSTVSLEASPAMHEVLAIPTEQVLSLHVNRRELEDALAELERR